LHSRRRGAPLDKRCSSRIIEVHGSRARHPPERPVVTSHAVEQPLRILFLDDFSERSAEFLALVPHGHWVETAADCIARLAEPWDVVFLDHDLGGMAFVDPREEDTGSGVVRWVVAQRPAVGRFIVHSLNQGAAEQMVADLQAAGYPAEYRPGAWTNADYILGTGEPD
jgi:hypothetical protein